MIVFSYGDDIGIRDCGLGHASRAHATPYLFCKPRRVPYHAASNLTSCFAMTRSCRPHHRTTPRRWAALLALSILIAHPGQAQTLKKPALDALVSSTRAAAPADLQAFMAAAAKAEPAVAPAVAAWQAKAPLVGPLARIRERAERWRRLGAEGKVGTLILGMRQPEHLGAIAEILLG